jgi:phosphopantetheinyl transferase (holo-ACP synthase)
MIGNDVVDLRDPESQAQTLHPRFDTRVFAAPELARVAAASDPNRERWRLWASKEAAYKLARKRRASTVFSPIRFVVRDDGQVAHANDRYCIEIREEDGAIHAVAFEVDSRPEMLCGLRQLDAAIDGHDPCAPSRAVRELVVQRLGEHFHTSPEAFELRRDGRIPRLRMVGAAQGTIDLSLSHHGRFVAFACAWRGSDAMREGSFVREGRFEAAQGSGSLRPGPPRLSPFRSGPARPERGVIL